MNRDLTGGRIDATSQVHDTSVSCTAAGYYRRSLGRFKADDGTFKPKVFTLGRDPKLAVARSLELERLWDQLVADFECQRRLTLKRFDDLAATGTPLMRSVQDPTPMTRGEIEQEQVHWTDTTLAIAEAVRSGATAVCVPRQPGEENVFYAERVHELSQRFREYNFVPAGADEAALQAGRRILAQNAEDLVAHAADCSHAAGVAVAAMPTGLTLYGGIEELFARGVKVVGIHVGQHG